MNFGEIPVRFHAHLDALIADASGTLAAGQEVMPTIYLGRADNDELVPFFYNISSDEMRERSVVFARALAMALPAEFVLVVSEAWSIARNDPNDPQEILRKYGSVSNYPGRIDCLSILIESHLDGLWMVQVPIEAAPAKPGKRPRRRLGSSPNVMRPTSGEGRLVGILPPAPGPTRH